MRTIHHLTCLYSDPSLNFFTCDTFVVDEVVSIYVAVVPYQPLHCRELKKHVNGSHPYVIAALIKPPLPPNAATCSVNCPDCSNV